MVCEFGQEAMDTIDRRFDKLLWIFQFQKYHLYVLTFLRKAELWCRRQALCMVLRSDRLYLLST